ncbi:M13-type metalloendopeptidase [Sphingomonas sp. Leaf230]|uniref:M13-type metalloendopeptidase n=1 Tax=Sphingomonas sp. Leaf230 TaxID=1735694 RepID=UPI001F456C0F|nr:M13-type metalloendopeptidase [Sphingomonas sp. Leaf230]
MPIKVSGGARQAPVIGGVSGDQRFFLAYAQAWQARLREGVARVRLPTDPHSPPFYRVNGIVWNVDAWYTAFGMKPGDALYLAPADRYISGESGGRAATLRTLFGQR